MQLFRFIAMFNLQFFAGTVCLLLAILSVASLHARAKTTFFCSQNALHKNRFLSFFIASSS